MSEPRRIRLFRTRGWHIADHSDNYAIVDRRSVYGNPWTIAGPVSGKWAVQHDAQPWPIVAEFDTKDKAAAFAVEQYRCWLTNDEFAAQVPKLSLTRDWILEHLHELYGKDLACWCGESSPCHATVLLALAAQAGGIR